MASLLIKMKKPISHMTRTLSPQPIMGRLISLMIKTTNQKGRTTNQKARTASQNARMISQKARTIKQKARTIRRKIRQKLNLPVTNITLDSQRPSN